jgi:hypothetical protein
MAQISSSPKASSRSAYEPTEETIARMIEGIRKFLNPQHGNTTPEEEAAAVIRINPATRKYCELEIKILQGSPRDPDKLRELLKAKQKEYDKAEASEVIEDLVTEIEMLKYVLFLVRKHGTNSSPSP